jgi:secreted trypsin-like serine protease
MRNKEYKLLGIVSFGNSECSGTGFYGRVYGVKEWIENIIKADTVKPQLGRVIQLSPYASVFGHSTNICQTNFVYFLIKSLQHLVIFQI